MTIALVTHTDKHGAVTEESTISIHNNWEDEPISGPYLIPTKRPDGASLPIARIIYMLGLLGYRPDPNAFSWITLSESGNRFVHVKPIPRDTQYAAFTSHQSMGAAACDECDEPIEQGQPAWCHPAASISDTYCTSCLVRLGTNQLRHNDDHAKIRALRALVADLSQERNRLQAALSASTPAEAR